MGWFSSSTGLGNGIENGKTPTELDSTA